MSFKTRVGPVDTNCSIWPNARRSYIFERTGRMEIGQRSLLSFGAEHLGMALMRATFQADGNILLEMKLLRIWVSGEAR